MKKMRRNAGFTLVEMLIVVAIIAILIAVSIPLVSNSLEKARISTDQANERAAKAEATIMYLNGDYVTSAGAANEALGWEDGDDDGEYKATYNAATGDFSDGATGYGKCTTGITSSVATDPVQSMGHDGGVIEVVLDSSDGSVVLTWTGYTDNTNGKPAPHSDAGRGA